MIWSKLNQDDSWRDKPYIWISDGQSMMELCKNNEIRDGIDKNRIAEDWIWADALQSIDFPKVPIELRHWCESTQLDGWNERSAICKEYGDRSILVIEMDSFRMTVNYCPFCGYKSKVANDRRKD